MKTIVHHHLEAADLLKIVNGEDLEITEANGEKITLPGFSDRDRHELRQLLGFPDPGTAGALLDAVSRLAPADPSTNLDTSPALERVDLERPAWKPKRKYTRRKKIRAKAASSPKKRKKRKGWEEFQKTRELERQAAAAGNGKPAEKNGKAALKCPGAPSCKKLFYSQAWLDNHLKKSGHGAGNGSAAQLRTRGWQPGKFDCRPCGVSFDTAGELTEHQVAKHGMKVSQSA